jgi:hypothetical protein
VEYLQERRSATRRRLAAKCMLLMTSYVAQSSVLKIFPFFETPVMTLWRVRLWRMHDAMLREKTCRQRRISCPCRRV